MSLSYTLKRLLTFPRTLWFNLRYLPFREAIHLPIWVANNVRVKNLHRGGIKFNAPISIGLVRIGYHCADAVDIYSVHTVIDIRKAGRLVFSGDAHIGRGALLCVKDGGELSMGEKFAISGTTSIVCSHDIRIGNNVQFSWNTLVMDSDAHIIWGPDKVEYLNSKPILIKNNIWVAANCTLLKGTVIQDNCVVASNSLLNKAYKNSNRIIGGIPASELKEIGGWHL